MIALTLRLDDAVHDGLRREAFDRRVSVSEIIRERIAAPEPQGEPSDAQVIAAMNALNGYEPPVTDISYWSGGYVEAMRAALTAAYAVRGGRG